MNCIAYRDPRRELFNTLKKETNLILDSMTPSSAFASLISMKQGEKTQKIVAKYVYDRFRERDSRVKYIEDITRWREDMNFIFEWQNNILRTSAASE